jgi:hypothetical protein
MASPVRCEGESPWEVAYSVAVAVAESTHLDFIDHGILVPKVIYIVIGLWLGYDAGLKTGTTLSLRSP